MNTSQTFEKLLNISKELRIFSSIHSLLVWDQDTFMPPKGVFIKGKQIAAIDSLVHKKATSKQWEKLLFSLIDKDTGKIFDSSLSFEQNACLTCWRRDFLQEKKLPPSFVKTFSEAVSHSVCAWGESKHKNSFALFEPHLKKMISLCRKKADFLGYQDHPYDALLDVYEPFMTVQKLNTLFSQLKPSLISLLDRIKTQKSIDTSFLETPIHSDVQRLLGKELLKTLPLDSSCSRLDESLHPFSTSMHPEDVRITTRLLPTSFISNLFAILHETGHGIYDANLPKEHFGSPLCEAISHGIHESQSRWWETLIGKSFPFWTYFYPILQKHIPSLKTIPLEIFYKAINKVSPSLIRIEADEVTYGLHILLRFEIEKALIEGSVSVKEVPDLWRAKMKELLGIVPSTDAEGCLQDIHWSCGYFGYFPSYALGNLYAAHFFKSFAKKHPDWEQKVSKGDFSFILVWLKENIHKWGRSYSSEELAIKITGTSLNEKAYVDYLNKKF